MSRRKVVEVAERRSVALAGHRSAGKTTLGDYLLFLGGATRQPGSVEEGTSLLDHDPLSRLRHSTVLPSFAWFFWLDHRIELVDAPGAEPLRGISGRVLAAADARLVVVDGSRSLQAGTEEGLLAPSLLHPRVQAIVVTHADRGLLPDLLEQLRAVSPVPVVPLQVPWAPEGQLVGLLHLVDRVLIGPDGQREPWTSEQASFAQAARERLEEEVAGQVDSLTATYLEHLALTDAQLDQGLATATAEGRLTPLVYAVPPTGLGVAEVASVIVRWLPSPQAYTVAGFEDDGTPFRAGPSGDFLATWVCSVPDEEQRPVHVVRILAGELPAQGSLTEGLSGASFRLPKFYELRGPRAARPNGPVGAGSFLGTWDPLPGRPGATLTAGNRVTVLPAPTPPNTAWWGLRGVGVSQDALRAALEKATLFDPALRLSEGPAGLVLGGLDEDHLDLTLRRLEVAHRWSVEAFLPPLALEERPEADAEAWAEHRRTSPAGLVVEFAACRLRVEPAMPGQPLFRDEAPDEEELPVRFRPAIERGVAVALRQGPHGWPVRQVRVTLLEGSYDILESEEAHFEKAAEAATRAALGQAGTRVLEPWASFVLDLPGTLLGPALGELQAQAGRIHGVDLVEGNGRITGELAWRVLRKLGPRLRALSGGRARWVSSPAAPQPLPTGAEAEAGGEVVRRKPGSEIA